MLLIHRYCMCFDFHWWNVYKNDIPKTKLHSIGKLANKKVIDVVERKRRTPIRLYRTRSVTLGSTHTHNGAPLSFTHTTWLRQATHTRKRLGTEAPIHTQCSANWRQGDLQFITIIITIKCGRHDSQYTTQITRERNLISRWRHEMCTRNGGCTQQRKEVFLDQTDTTIASSTLKKPPLHYLCTPIRHSGRELGPKWASLTPNFALGCCLQQNQQKMPSRSSFFSLHLLLSFSPLW